MSKAFTKDHVWDGPLVVPPRAPLPAGVPNYVTPRGLLQLRAEHVALEAERVRLRSGAHDEIERRQRLAILAGRLNDLAARIASANVVDPRDQPRDEVRFGATVTLRTTTGDHNGEERRLEIVGVDEADAANGRVAFLAPIACAILGRRVGETAVLRTARGEEELQITAIAYESD